ncbi:VOC family protein [Teredinibacter franksiae]|jgi:Glyoxalase/Bleomycin resistance protein/Dioxygenase superfamily.|uniref:VOC family protein n=1 Tax=Teredinibacter franksiae TaxID=2761453 RepID=UPI001623BEF1|nr:VOC family protein [Teredinibacter franksiae]
MKIEHFAFNVTEPVEIAAWYCKNLGFTVKHKFDQAPNTHFLADETGQVMIEIYCNPPEEVPEYANMNPLQLHLAFVSHDPVVDAERLIGAGCQEVDDLQLADGTHLKMLKDPWGFSIQLCKRGKPML